MSKLIYMKTTNFYINFILEPKKTGIAQIEQKLIYEIERAQYFVMIAKRRFCFFLIDQKKVKSII